jgi:myo-inositol-1(or 4)-monophosphatase
MSQYLDFATQLALQTGELLLSRFKLSGTCATLKADRSFVTEIDIAADHLITASIQKEFPEDTILSEESRTDLDGSDSAVWVIDPLDGTTNYSLGLHVWGVSIARLVNGWSELAAIYFPLIQELYTVERQGGAFLNGKPIQVGPPDPTNPMSFFACCSRTHRRYDVSIPYKARILGSAAYTFCMLARGTALIGFEVTPKIWDIAGAWLLVQEAGGVIQSLDAPGFFPLISSNDYAQVTYPTLAAATPELLSITRTQIQPKALHLKR